MPSFTAKSGDSAAPERNRRVASAGIQALRSTCSTCSIAARAGLVWFTALATCTTIGMPANWPCTSVDERNFSPKLTPPLLNLMALARSMVCGKSTFHSCGGTYGHLVM